MKVDKLLLEDEESFDAGAFTGVDQYKSEGHKLMMNRAFRKAAYYFKKSLEVDKESVITLVHRSYCNLRLGSYVKAMKDIEEALQRQPKNVAALVQKADTFYFMGKLEEALVYFYRAKNLAPNMRKPALWVYICESAIMKTVGDPKMLLTTEGDMSFLEAQIEENQVTQETSPQMSKLMIATRPPLEDEFESIKDVSKDWRVIKIMGDMYEDRKYMQMIFDEADRKTSLGNRLRRYTYAMIQFIDKQTIKLLHEAAPIKKVRRRKPLPSITVERARINQRISHVLSLIDIEQQEKNYEQSLERAQALLEFVLTQPEGVIKKLEEVIATIYGYIGYAYLQMKDLQNAMIFFKKEKDLSLRHKLDNTYLHSMYCIGVVYVLMGEFKKAINIWSVRLSYATSSEERCWLLHEMGRSYYALCDFQRALELGEKAMEESKKFDDDMWRLNCLILLAQAKTRLSQFSGALDDFVYALEIACSLGEACGREIDPLIEAIGMCIEDLRNILKVEKEKVEGKLGTGLADEGTSTIGVQTIRLEDKETLTELEKLEVDFLKDLDDECAKMRYQKLADSKSRSLPPRVSLPPALKKYAYVTLATNDIYAVGALVLGETLIQTKTPYDTVALITNEVTEPLKMLLEKTFDHVITVDPIVSVDSENLSLLKREELGITFTKINAWRLVEYDKCVFLDADIIVLHNIDELFQKHPFSAAPDAGWPDCFNSGVFVYRPSLDMFKEIIEFAMQHGSFDGGDQGLLNQFFDDWKNADIQHHLSFTYNMAWQAYYSYKPALKEFGAEIKVVHYIGAPKPWEHDWDPTKQRFLNCCNPMETIQDSELLQLWWDIFMTNVQNKLPKDYEGVIGKLSNLRVRTPASGVDIIASVDRQRQYKWERNEIDYMGDDRFENIQKKLDQLIPPPTEPKTREGGAGYRCVRLAALKQMAKETASRRAT